MTEHISPTEVELRALAEHWERVRTVGITPTGTPEWLEAVTAFVTTWRQAAVAVQDAYCRSAGITRSEVEQVAEAFLG